MYQDLGQQHNLGNFKKKYRRVPSLWYHFVVCLIVLLFFAGIAVAIVPVWVLIPPALEMRFMMEVIGVLVVLFLLLWLLYHVISLARDIIKEFQVGRLEVLLYDQGFITYTTKDIIQLVVRWTEIDVHHEIWGGDGDPDTYTFRFRDTEKSMELPFFGREFEGTVELEVTTCQYPPAQAAYLSGNVVNFGCLRVSSQGLYDTTKRTTLAWNEVESIKTGGFGQVHLNIKQREPRRSWASFRLGQVANVATLRRLLESDAPRSFMLQME